MTIDQHADQPAQPAGGVELPNDSHLCWTRAEGNWRVIMNGEWAVGWIEDTNVRATHVDLLPRGNWKPAAPEQATRQAAEAERALPTVIGFGAHPETNDLLHAEIAWNGKRYLIWQQGAEWRVGVTETPELRAAIEAALTQGTER